MSVTEKGQQIKKNTCRCWSCSKILSSPMMGQHANVGVGVMDKRIGEELTELITQHKK